MTRSDLQEIWNYYLMLEEDLDNTSRYMEPKGQEDTFSFEFAKLLILSCVEVESVFKILCKAIDSNEEPGDISDYKRIILGRFPQIVEVELNVPRFGRNIKPFDCWGMERLQWWDAYQDVKHSRRSHFSEATYINAYSALSALHILILYLFQLNGFEYSDLQGKYIKNPYCNTSPIFGRLPKIDLPGTDSIDQ